MFTCFWLTEAVFLFPSPSDWSTSRSSHIDRGAETRHLPITLRNAWNESKAVGLLELSLLFISRWQRLFALLSPPRENKPPWRNPYVRVQEVTGKLPDPEIRLPPRGWDMPHRTKPAELCQSSHFSHAFQENVDKEHADLVRVLKRNARKHYDRSHSQYIWEKCVILLPQFLISVCTCLFSSLEF